MTLSDALPIQFWDIDDDTYNENDDVAGMNFFCFCQDWEVNDVILLQFQDTSGYNFYLTPIYEDGTYGGSDQFNQSGDTYSLSNTQGTLGINVQTKFTLLISRGNPNDLITYLVLAPSSWVDVAGVFDSKTATEFIETGLAASKSAEQACVVPDGLPCQITYAVTIAGAFTGNVTVEFYLSNTSSGASISEDLSAHQTSFTAAGTYAGIIAIMKPVGSDANFLAVRLSWGSLTGTPDVTITVSPGAMLSIGGIEMQSDCQKFYNAAASEPSYTNSNELITYSNDSDVFDIDYESGSPSAEFSIRLPLRFFHESFPQEEEVHQLSSDEWLTMWSRLEAKKLLEVGFVPYYIHKKLQLILMHDNIAIDGEYWVRRDPYQIVDGSMKYPLKKANVLLTNKDVIERNLI